MNRRLAFLLLLFWMAPVAASDNPRTLLVLGDSLSAAHGMAVETGWVALLERRLAEQGLEYQVVNASISGETSSGALSRLPMLLKRHRPEVVVIELGGNDGLRGLPLAALESNLAKLIDMSRAEGASALLVGMRLPPNYGPDYTEQFHNIYKELSQRKEVPLVPFLLQGVAGKATLMQPDGIHAAADAQPQLLENVWPKLRLLLTRPSPQAANATVIPSMTN